MDQLTQHSSPTRRSSDLGHGRLPAHCARGCVERDDGIRLAARRGRDRKSTRLNSSHLGMSYAVFCLIKKSSLKLPVIWLLVSMWLNTLTKRQIWTLLLKV